MKNNNKKINAILGLFVLTLFTLGCSEEFLDFTPTGVLSESDLGTVDAAEQLVIAAYASLGNDGLVLSAYQDMWAWGTSRSDDGYKGGGGIGDGIQDHNAEIFTSMTPNGSFQDINWSKIYQGISRVNEAMRRVNAIDESVYQSEVGVSKAQRLAELRFIRGHFEFIMKKLHKFPVFIDENVPKDEIISISNRALSDQEGWNYIANEFRDGVANLPETQSDEGRPTKNAAKLYLAKVLLFKAYVQDDNHQVIDINTAELEEVVALIDEVEATGEYGLYDDYAQNFLWEFESGIESVWSIIRSIDDGTNDGRGNYSTGLTSSVGPGYGCCGFNQPSQNLANAFKTDENGLPLFNDFNDGVQIETVDDVLGHNMDPRIAHTMGIIGMPFKYDPNRIFDETYARVPGVYGFKVGMKDQELPESPSFRQYEAFFSISRNTDQIRWAEVMLWKAEALIELGRMDEALPYINQVRRRAASPGSLSRIAFADGSPTGNWVVGEYPTLGSQDQAREILRFEKRLETAFESKRFFDLVRWGIAEEVLNEYFDVEKISRSHLNDARFTSGRDEYFPIPQNQINISRGLYQQNPGF